MGKNERPFVVKIEQAGKVFYRRLTNREQLTIGQSPENDVTLYGEQFPKKHVLFARKHNCVQLFLKNYIQGEVKRGDSRVGFNDLMVHGLLPAKGDNYFLSITSDRHGHLVVGDARISFAFDGAAAAAERHFAPQDFKGYSWLYATAKDLLADMPFKATLIVMVALHVVLLQYLSERAKNFIPPTPTTTEVPERLTRFIIRKEPPGGGPGPAGPDVAARPKGEETAGSETPKGSEEGHAEPDVESRGVLGLLSGTGVSNQSNSLADFLMDSGLAASLDEVMSTSALTVGKGEGDDTSLDDLIALSEPSRGIDDLLGDEDGVEGVEFGKRVNVEVEGGGGGMGMRGSSAGLGYRSEASVRAVLAAYMGRLTYIYEKHLRRNPNLTGKMVVEVTIVAAGHVESARLISSTMNNSQFEREILDVVRRWKYEPIAEGTVTVTYPLVFNRIE